MKIKTHIKIIVALLVLFVSGNVWGQWDGSDPVFNPDSSTEPVSTSPVLSMEFNNAISITINPGMAFFIENIDDTDDKHQLFTGFPPYIPMDSKISINGNIVSFDMSTENLSADKTYRVYSDNVGIFDIDGLSYEGIFDNSAWTFTTEPEVVLPPPSITSYNPTPNTSGVLINQDLQVTFNEEIKKGTSGSIHIRYSSDDSDFASFTTGNNSVQVSGSTVTINAPTFDYNTDYYVVIEDGYILNTSDVAFGGISEPDDWYFTTEVVMPTSQFSPTNTADGISIQSQIIITYSEGMIKTDDTELIDADLVDDFITLQNEGVDLPFTAVISADKTTITITPTNNLPEFEGITTTISSLKGITGGGESGIISSYFTTDGLITWNGSVSTDISDNNNWTGTFVEGISVHIPKTSNNPTVSSGDHYVRNLTIDPGATFTIDPLAKITVGKTLELRSSNDPNIGNANLMIDGELSTDGADVIVHQMVERDLVALYVSSPVQSSTLAGSSNVRSAYAYNSPSASWASLGQDDTFDAGIGYFAYADEGNITFSGPVNQTDIPAIETYRTTSPNNYGWNLLGNPYPCSIDWNLVDKTNMKDQFYIMKRDNQSYGVYNAGGGSQVNLDPDNPSHIPSCHAFWTQVPLYETKGSVSFTSGSRVDTHYSYLKTTSTNSQQEIRFSGVNSDDIEDELLITFNDQSDDSFDDFDSERRMSSNNELLQLYTIHSNKKIVIDSYNNLDANKNITLGYQVGQEGTYRIKLKDLVNIDDNININLEDTELGTLTRLEKDTEYTFQTESGANNDRFIINLQSTSTDLPTEKNNQNILIYSANDNIIIKTPDLLKPTYKIYDISGALIDAGNLSTNSTNIIKSKALGIIIVKVTSVDQNYNQKIVVKK